MSKSLEVIDIAGLEEPVNIRCPGLHKTKDTERLTPFKIECFAEYIFNTSKPPATSSAGASTWAKLVHPLDREAVYARALAMGAPPAIMRAVSSKYPIGSKPVSVTMKAISATTKAATPITTASAAATAAMQAQRAAAIRSTDTSAGVTTTVWDNTPAAIAAREAEAAATDAQLVYEEPSMFTTPVIAGGIGLAVLGVIYYRRQQAKKSLSGLRRRRKRR